MTALVEGIFLPVFFKKRRKLLSPLQLKKLVVRWLVELPEICSVSGTPGALFFGTQTESLYLSFEASLVVR